MSIKSLSRRRGRPIPIGPRKLTAQDLSKIVDLITAWPRRTITWESLVEAIGGYVGHTWSRQSLEKHAPIKEAYLSRRAMLKSAAVSGEKVVDPAEAILRRRVQEQQVEITQLKQTITAYEDLFIRHHYNAHARGISEAELAAELPPIDRGRTDVERPRRRRRGQR